MFKLAIVGTIAAFVAATHPVNSDIVHEIKTKTSSWHVHEAHANPLRDLSMDDIKARLGTIV